MITFEQYMENRGHQLMEWQQEAAWAFMRVVDQNKGASGKTFLLNWLQRFLDEYGNCFGLDSEPEPKGTVEKETVKEPEYRYFLWPSSLTLKKYRITARTMLRYILDDVVKGKAIEVKEADLPYLKKPEGEWEFRKPDIEYEYISYFWEDGVSSYGPVIRYESTCSVLDGYRWCRKVGAKLAPKGPTVINDMYSEKEIAMRMRYVLSLIDNMSDAPDELYDEVRRLSSMLERVREGAL